MEAGRSTNAFSSPPSLFLSLVFLYKLSGLNSMVGQGAGNGHILSLFLTETDFADGPTRLTCEYMRKVGDWEDLSFSLEDRMELALLTQ